MKKQLSTSLFFLFQFCICSSAFSQTITQLSFFSPLISTFDMDYLDDHLLISQQYLITADVSDPENPDLVGQVLYPGSYAYQVAGEGTHAYMAMGGNGIFAVYNISNFSMPYLTGFVPIPSTAFLVAGDLVPHGEIVFMAGFDTLFVIDVSDSSAPHVINTQEIQDVGFGGAGAMGIVDSSLFVSTPVAFQVFNISDPSAPTFVTSVTNTHIGQKGLAVDTVGKRIFLPWTNTLATHLGYDAFDITNPVSPVYLFSDSTAFGSGDYGETAYFNNVLFISKGGGVTAFDVSTFNHHFVTSFTGQDVPNASVALDVRDSVFFNARGGGFEVLLYSGGFPTGTANMMNDGYSIRFFPNPMAAQPSKLVFNCSTPFPNATIRIYDAMGERISAQPNVSLERGLNELSLDHALASGMYLVIVESNSQTMSSKVMVE